MEALLRTLREAGPSPRMTHHAYHQHVGKPAKRDKGPFEFGLDLILDGLERMRDPA